MDDLLRKLRDALETAAMQYTPTTDEQREEWQMLVQEADEVLDEEGDAPS